MAYGHSIATMAFHVILLVNLFLRESIMLFRIVLVFLTLSIGGCATYITKSQFQLKELDWYTHPKAVTSINGESFLKTRGGEVKTCAGNRVQLVPVSAYSTERVVALYGNSDSGFFGRYHRQIDDPVPSYTNNILTAVCDSKGEFSFDNVPIGEYYLTTLVSWESSDYVFEGGALMKKVQVNEKTAHQIITY